MILSWSYTQLGLDHGGYGRKRQFAVTPLWTAGPTITNDRVAFIAGCRSQRSTLYCRPVAATQAVPYLCLWSRTAALTGIVYGERPFSGEAGRSGRTQRLHGNEPLFSIITSSPFRRSIVSMLFLRMSSDSYGHKVSCR